MSNRRNLKKLSSNCNDGMKTILKIKRTERELFNTLTKAYTLC